MVFVVSFLAAFLPLFLIGVLFFIFWIIMIVDAAKRKFAESNDKIVWILVLVLVGWIGALVYYFVVYRRHKSLKLFWITILVLFVLWVILIAVIALVSVPTGFTRVN